MFVRVAARWFLACLSISTLSVAMHAQSAPPTTYTLVENFDVGQKSVVKSYRNGSKAAVDAKTETMHIRQILDFDKHQSVSWDETNATAPCERSVISADWGDPFSQSSSFEDDLKKSNAKQEPSETLLGIKAEVWSTSNQEGEAKIWIDKAHSLLLKYQVTAKSSPARTLIEVTEVSFAPPPEAMFVEPARCASAAPPMHVPIARMGLR